MRAVESSILIELKIVRRFVVCIHVTRDLHHC